MKKLAKALVMALAVPVGIIYFAQFLWWFSGFASDLLDQIGAPLWFISTWPVWIGVAIAAFIEVYFE